MGSILTANYVGSGKPKTRIEISGVNLKPDPRSGDVELRQSVLGTRNPDSVVSFGEFTCEATSLDYNSGRANVKVRMKDDEDQWTDFVLVSS